MNVYTRGKKNPPRVVEKKLKAKIKMASSSTVKQSKGSLTGTALNTKGNV